MKVTIKQVSVSDTKKDGSKLVTKDGKPFFKVGIKTAEHADEWINGLVFGDRPSWKEGDELDLLIEDEVYNGVKRKKFEIPKKADTTLRELNELAIKVGKIDVKIDKILKLLQPKESEMTTSDGAPMPFPDDANEDYDNL